MQYSLSVKRSVINIVSTSLKWAQALVYGNVVFYTQDATMVGVVSGHIALPRAS